MPHDPVLNIAVSFFADEDETMGWLKYSFHDITAFQSEYFGIK